jgi:hypothetical protein
LDNITDEMEESEVTSVYDDYKFVTKDELVSDYKTFFFVTCGVAVANVCLYQIFQACLNFASKQKGTYRAAPSLCSTR